MKKYQKIAQHKLLKITSMTTSRSVFIYLLLMFFAPNLLQAQITIDQFMGVNMRREDVTERMKAVGIVREYHDWHINEGFQNISYNGGITFDDHSPGYPNSKYKWNTSYHGITSEKFDAFYDTMQGDDLSIGITILGNTLQLVRPDATSHLTDQHIILEEKPVAPGANTTDPASYIAHAEYLYHLSARYGQTTFSTAKANAIIAPKLHAQETIRTGLGTVTYLENWNEHDKDWFLRFNNNPATFFSPAEYAAMTSADYDGHNQTLGLMDDPDNPGQMISTVGMKNADPSMQSVMSGLAFARLSYIREMVDWFKANRPADATFGQIPLEVINIHNYAGNADDFYDFTSGVSPEAFGLRPFLKTFDTYRDSLEQAFHQDFELWLSEFGYDTNDVSPTRAPSIGSTDNYEVQAQWIIRSFMEATAAGIDRALVYDLRDNCSQPDCGLFQSSGLLENKANDHKPKNSWYYTYTMKNVLKGMVFVADQSPCADTTCARIYKFHDPTDPHKRVFVAWSPTASNKSFQQVIDLEGAADAQLVKMELPSIYGVVSPLSGSTPSIEVSERPVFVMVGIDDYFAAAPCTANLAVAKETCSTIQLNWDAAGSVETYQLWYQEGKVAATNFSHRLAKLVSDEIPASQLAYTVTELKENTDYTFFLIPEGIGQNEVDRFCTIEALTTTKTCQIQIDPVWIYDYARLYDNADNLVDEQAGYDPFCGNTGVTKTTCGSDFRKLEPSKGLENYYFNSWLFNPNLRKSDALGLLNENRNTNPLCRAGAVPATNWGVDYQNADQEQVSIDLQNDYFLEALSIFDAQGIGTMTIQYATSPNGPWTTVVEYRTVDYQVWKTFSNIFPAATPIRYLRILASADDAVNIGELSICGIISNVTTDIPPGKAENIRVVNSACDSIDLAWDHPFDNDIATYKIVADGALTTVSFIPGTQTATIFNLMEDSGYDLKVITVDNAGQESDTVTITAYTFAEGDCDLTCNLSCACQICLKPGWITDLTPHPDLTPSNLIDEQNTLPICGIGGNPATFWGNVYNSGTIPPTKMEISLPDWYLIHTFYLHDGVSSGMFTVEYQDSVGAWKTLIGYQTAAFNQWITFANLEIKTNKLRISQLDNGANVNEIGLCGEITTVVEACPTSLTIDSMLTTTAIYKAENITSASEIITETDITYKAATSIRLTSGFHAVSGTSFLAKIEDCDATLWEDQVAATSRTSIASIPTTAPSETKLLAYPNPFQGQLTIDYQLPRRQRINLTLLDYLGRLIEPIITSEFQEAGSYHKTLTTTHLESGTYFLHFNNGDNTVVEKIVLLR